MDKKIEKIYSRKKLKIPKDCSSIELKGFYNISKTFKIIIIIIIAILVARAMINAINPIIKQECIMMAKAIATKVSNQEATRVMKNYTYEDLTNISKDEKGNIKMISANIITINQIISDIPILMQEQLEKQENNTFNIKLGSLTGKNILSGRGPNIPIKMSVNGNVETDLKSEFNVAGINQTLHRIYLEVKCNVSILTPFKVIEEQIVNQVLLVEGIIIGEIPDTYYNLEGLTQDQSLEAVN